MIKPKRHLFLCKSFRTGGDSQGVCAKKGPADLMSYLQNELDDRGMGGDTQVTTCGCLQACTRGPVMLVYPEGLWVGGLESQEKLDEALDALQEGRAPAGCF